MEGELAFWAAVLAQAVRDVRSPRHDVRRDALKWFTSDSHEPGSLRFICDAIGVDIQTVRVRVKSASGRFWRPWAHANNQRQRKAAGNVA